MPDWTWEMEMHTKETGLLWQWSYTWKECTSKIVGFWDSISCSSIEHVNNSFFLIYIVWAEEIFFAGHGDHNNSRKLTTKFTLTYFSFLVKNGGVLCSRIVLYFLWDMTTAMRCINGRKQSHFSIHKILVINHAFKITLLNNFPKYEEIYLKLDYQLRPFK